MTRETEDQALTAAVQVTIEHGQGVSLPAPRAARYARLTIAVRGAVDAVAPTLFDTEPADLTVLLEQVDEEPR